jgi:BASS family bile acid:Na+ symporter
METLIDVAIPLITFLLLTAVGLDLTPADFDRVRRQPRVIAAGLGGPLLVLPPLALMLIGVLRPALLAGSPTRTAISPVRRRHCRSP